MTPKRLDVEVVQGRLRQLRTVLDQLEALGAPSTADLERDPVARAAAERFVQFAVDLAVDVNAHVVVAATGAAPTSARRSFLGAAEVGALAAPLAEQLAPVAGLRNVLVHRYADIRVDLLAAALPNVADLLGSYVAQMAAYVLRQADG